MGWRSTLLILILVFVLFSALYASTEQTKRIPYLPNNIPTQPKISQLEAIQIVEHHLKKEIPELNQVRLYFTLYNFSSQRWQNNPEYQKYISTAARGGWSYSHVKEKPELLQLPLFFVHANGTQYQVSQTDNTYKVLCLQAPDIANCSFPAFAADAIRGKLVYRIESIWQPSVVAFPSLSISSGYHIIDAETGQLLWNTINWEKSRNLIPKGVNFYDDQNNPPKTVKQLEEEKQQAIEGALNPHAMVTVSIVQGASSNNQSENFVPKEARGILGINNKIIWINEDVAIHTVTSEKGYSSPYTGSFDSGQIMPKATYNYTFVETGKYPYYCVIHPFMRGEVRIVPGFS